MSGDWTTWGNTHNWPAPVFAIMTPHEAFEYYVAMDAEFERRAEHGRRQLAQVQATGFSAPTPVSTPVPAFIHPTSHQFGGQSICPVQQTAPPAYSADQAQSFAAPNAASRQSVAPQMAPEQQAAPPASLAGQPQWTPALYAAPRQSVAPQMAPAQQVAAPTIFANQVNWNLASQSGPTSAVTGSQFTVPQAAPSAPQASQADWVQAPYAAPQGQFGQNMPTGREISSLAVPLSAPQVAFAHHEVPTALPAHMLAQFPMAAPSASIDLTGNDQEVAPSNPAPQRASTKRARSDSTSGPATPKVKKEKKPKKEKKVKVPKIPNSGLRVTPVVAAAIALRENNNSIPSQGDAPAVQQQQQQDFSAAVATEPVYHVADTTPELTPTDSAVSGWDIEQQQQQQDLCFAVDNQFSSNAPDLNFDVQETQETQETQKDNRPIEVRLMESLQRAFGP
jgi:hypothetical protein